jgi:hypothetical protein
MAENKKKQKEEQPQEDQLDNVSGGGPCPWNSKPDKQ